MEGGGYACHGVCVWQDIHDGGGGACHGVCVWQEIRDGGGGMHVTGYVCGRRFVMEGGGGMHVTGYVWQGYTMVWDMHCRRLHMHSRGEGVDVERYQLHRLIRRIEESM